MSEQPTPTRFAWLRAVLQKKRVWLLLALTAILCGLFSFQGPRCCLDGWLRLEPTYRWLPTSYWRAALLDQLRLAATSTAPPTDFMPLMRYEWQRHYDANWSLGAQAKRLNQRDPKMIPLLRCLLDDPDPQVRFQAIGLVTLLEKDETRDFYAATGGAAGQFGLPLALVHCPHAWTHRASSA